MQYQYEAKDRQGKTVGSVIEADSLAAARQGVRQDGLFVISLKPAGGKSSVSNSTSRLSSGKVATTDLMMFMSQLTIMLQSGVDLSAALSNLTVQITNPKLRSILQTVSQDVDNGVAFSLALGRHPTAFSPTICSGVAAGEQSGDMTGVLQRLSKLIRNDVKLTGTIKSMLAYPFVLCGITLMVLVAMLFFVLPQFAIVFADLDRPAPPLTKALLTFGETIQSHVWLLLGGVAMIGVGMAAASKTNQFKRFIDRGILYFPVLNKAARSLISGRVLRLLGTLLSAGIPLIDCIQLCRRSSKNLLFQQLFENIESDVLNGDGLSKSLLSASFLPVGAAQMIQTGENSGNLGGVLQTIGEYYEEEGERHLRDTIKIAEPAMIVFLGAVVAVIVLAVLIPLLDVTTASGA